ncbi:MAG: hypothetical protein AAFV25_05225 [Bacteroidota bacterium]
MIIKNNFHLSIPRRFILLALIYLLTICWLSPSALAQTETDSLQLGTEANPAMMDTSQQWTIETLSGNQFTGIILEQNKDIVRLQTKRFGEMNLKVKNIKSMTAVKSTPRFEPSPTQGISPVDTSQQWVVKTRDGNRFTGAIVERSQELVRLQTDQMGTIDIQSSNILSIEPIKEDRLVNNEYWDDNPQANRYFFSPSAFNLKEGETYWQNGYILFNQISLAPTDNWTISFGTLPLFFFRGASTPLWMSNKWGIPIKNSKFRLAIGGAAGVLVGDGVRFIGGLNGTLTYGSEDRNISVSYSRTTFDSDTNAQDFLTISGMRRVSSRLYLMTENWISVNNFILFSFGARWAFNKLILDVGVSQALQFGSSITPYVGIALPLGGQ